MVEDKASLKTKDHQFDNFVPLVAPEVVITTTYGATNDNKVIKLMIFCFQGCLFMTSIF